PWPASRVQIAPDRSSPLPPWSWGRRCTGAPPRALFRRTPPSRLTRRGSPSVRPSSGRGSATRRSPQRVRPADRSTLQFGRPLAEPELLDLAARRTRHLLDDLQTLGQILARHAMAFEIAD